MGVIAQLEREGKPRINHLHPHHRSMARSLVKHGLTPGQLGALYGFSPSQTSVILNSPLFKAHVAYLESLAEHETQDALQDLKSLQPRSAEVLAEDLMIESDAPLEALRLRQTAALAVFDRTGHPKGVPVQKHAHLHGHVHKQIQEMDTRDLYMDVLGMVEEEEE